ncbi:MAG: cytochrome c biogenesis protein ResB [Deltaproteobacteria bacterium]|nr:cytochrome c biogenesis protein ResB [Deltaproteobacteria bacterium]
MTGFFKRVWNFFASTTLTIVLAALVCIDAAVGSMVVLRNRAFFDALDREILLPWLFTSGTEHPGKTLWIFIFVFLIALFAVNTAVCTADRLYLIIRKKSPFRSFLPQAVHVGFLIALLGHLAGSLYGFRSYGNLVVKGEALAVPHAEGLSMRLDGVDVRFDDAGEVESLSSAVTLLKGGTEVKKGGIRPNSPLIYRGMAFYYVDHGRSVTGFLLDASGERKEAGFGKGFVTADGKRYSLGALYPDMAFDVEGRPYSRSGQYRNPYQEITSIDDNESGFLDVSRPGGGVSIGGKTITLVNHIVSPYAVFTINKDPGIWFIIAGSFVLTAGMVLLLFSRGEKGELFRTRG